MFSGLRVMLILICILFYGAFGAVNANASATVPQYQKLMVSPKSGGGGKPTWGHTVYGDSIFSGWCGLFCSPASRNGAKVQSEYLADKWDVNINHQGRCVAGATARQIYKKVQKDALYMQDSNTKAITIEMCGNDFLQARAKFRLSSGCDESVLADALSTCKEYMAKTLDFINENANRNPPGEGGVVKYMMNLYYPGFNADKNKKKSSCNGRSNMDVFLPYIVRSNWAACDLATQKGFMCADAFAEFMGADYETNNLNDIQGLRYVKGESEESYFNRITKTLKHTLRDAHEHRWRHSVTYDYLQSDDVHPSYSRDDRSDFHLNGHNRAGYSLRLSNE